MGRWGRSTHGQKHSSKSLAEFRGKNWKGKREKNKKGTIRGKMRKENKRKDKRDTERREHISKAGDSAPSNSDF